MWVAGLYLALLPALATPFRRDSVERIPYIPIRMSPLLATPYRAFGSHPLPLREAVEHVPSRSDRAEERFPLRDAVEKQPTPFVPLLRSRLREAPANSSKERESTKIFCFVEAWAAYRRSPATFTADNIDPYACTHIVYAFATVDPHTNRVVPQDTEFDIVKGGYRSVVGLKRTNPLLKVLLSVSGHLGPMAMAASSRRSFVVSLVKLLQQHGFDGLDIHWEYPGATELGGSPMDKDNLSRLVEETAGVLHAAGWELTATVSPSRWHVADGYDVVRLAPHLDYALLKSFDLHMERDSGSALHPAPLIASAGDPLAHYFNVDYAVRLWLKSGLRRSQLVLGIPFYARTFTLASSHSFAPGAAITGPGVEGRYTQRPGLLSYYEVCERLESGWVNYRDNTGASYVVKDDQWIGYDDAASITNKVAYTRQSGLAGVMLWSLDLDDFKGLCGPAYPLLNTVRAAMAAGNSNLIRSRIEQQQQYQVQQVHQALIHKAKPTSPSESSHHFRVVCYFTNWAWYRKGEAKFFPEHIDPRLCTHVVYAFASLEPNDLMVTTSDPWADIDNNLYQRLTSLSGPRVLLSLGGWTDSAGDKYSRLVSDSTARRVFVAAAVGFLRRHSFDGLLLDWNYPVCWHSDCRKGPRTDQPNFTKLIQELHDAFNRASPRLTFAVALSGYKEIIEAAYDVAAISKAVDFITVSTYDYHGAWEGRTGHISPLFGTTSDKIPYYNTNWTLNALVGMGADARKLVVGIPFYGQTFTLKSPDLNKVGAPTSDLGRPGEFTQQPGMMAYYEICYRVEKQQWKTGRDASGPYAYSGDQWAGYEDIISVKEKAKYVKANGYGGVTAWTLDLDDFSNRCCLEPFPLLRALSRELGLLAGAGSTAHDCTKPETKPTPPPPVTTLAPDSGLGTPTTEHEHYHPTTSSTTTSTTTKPETTSITSTASTTVESAVQTTTTTRPESTTWSSTQIITADPLTTQKPAVNHPALPPPLPTEPRPPSSSEAPPPTTEACSSGEYYPAPGNCNAFYRCSLGELRKEQCAGGLHWNQQQRVCDWPAAANCNSEAGEAASTTTTVANPPKWSPETTTHPSDSWTQPSSTQSSIWWKPSDTTTTSSSEWWTQPSTQSSIWWQPPPSTPSTTTTTTQSWWEPSSTTSTTVVPGSEGERCQNGQYYPRPGSCSQFYQCVNGNLVPITCASGLVWNQALGICDWSFNVRCLHAPSLRRATVWGRAGSSGCTKGLFTAHPTSCTKYLQCQWDKYEVATCPPGLHWNKKRNNCDWPKAAMCDTESRHPPAPTLPPDHPSHSSSTTTTPITEWSWTDSTQTEWSWTSKPTTHAPTKPTTPGKPYVHPLSGYFKVVCYFTNWAWYRQGPAKYLPDDIDSDLCTHIVYGFAVLDYENLVVKPHDSWADFDNKFYERVVALKRKGVKVSLALGGWNDSQGDKYSRLVNSAAARRRFVAHVVSFLLKHQFDGLDLDWEYPKCWQVNCEKGPDSDKENFGLWVRELRAAFKEHSLLLSAAVSPSKTVIDAGYDVKALAESLDWVAVMTYDYHGQWDKKTGHVAPMYTHPDDDFFYFNSNYTLHYWISEGVPRRKVIMGMPLYGQSFSLSNSSNTGLNSPASGPGTAGEYTRAAGFLAYYEICDRIKNQGWTVVQDAEHRMGPYAYKDNQWVSFDDMDMIRRKSEWIREMDIGGGMVWALDLDDFRNTCGQGKHPLLSIIARTLTKPPGSMGISGTTESYQPSSSKEPEVGVSVPSGTEVTKPPEEPTTKPPKRKPPASHIPKPTKPVSTTITTTTESYHPSSTEASTTEIIEMSSEAISTHKPVQPMDDRFKVVCYFTNWAWYRQGTGKYLPSNIDPQLCTHIVYGFAVLDADQLTIKPHDSWADFDNKFYEKVTGLKKKGMKVTVAIGGWNDSAGSKYSRLVNSASARAKFTAHVTQFILDNNFDGLDLDWEYPKCWQVNCKLGPDSDKDAFSDWVKELRAAFSPHGLLLSAAVSPSRTVMDAGYDVKVLSDNLDWIAVMAYDYHGQWDKITGHVAPMYAHPDDVDVTFNANFTMHYWVREGADKRKLVMGMPMYGQSFSLADNAVNDLNAPTYGGGEAGDETRARGFLAYYEICSRIQKRGWEVVRDPKNRIGPYARKGDQWVGFDDQAMIQHKSEFVRENGFGGAMIWALDLDDFRNDCGCEEYPLLRTINRVLRHYPGPGPTCTLSADDSRGDYKPMVPKPTVPKPEPPNSPATKPMPGAAGNGSVGASRACLDPGSAITAHDGDCNKFYACQFGQRLVQSCPPGLHFNKKGLMCDWPESAGCNDIPSPPKSPTVDVDYPPSVDNEIIKPAHTTEAAMVNTETMNGGYKVVCYFTNWAWYRVGQGKYLPEDIDAGLCTHIVYAFAVLDGDQLKVKSHDSWADIDNGFYHKVVELKKRGAKVILGLGGWNDSLGDKYSRLVNSEQSRQTFVDHISVFIKQHGFDGLDLDWEYPKCWQVDCSKGPESDKEGFAALVRELSAVFKPNGWLLSAAVSPSKVVIQEAYDVPTLNRYLDWVGVMAYDFHGHWDGQTGHVAPLYYSPKDTFSYFNTNFSIGYWQEQGLASEKLVLGMPLYGQTFTLANISDTELGAKSTGPGRAGEFTRAEGFLAFYEICELVSSQKWEVVRSPEGLMGPIAYKDDQWVSYDDVQDIRRKVQFIKARGLGGAMVWALDLDDFNNRCGCGTNPLLATINVELRGHLATTHDCT